MKREELLAKGYTEEQVTDLLNLFHNAQGETKKENESLRKELESKSALEERANSLQKQLDAINEANLTEQERIAKEKEEADKYLLNAKKINNTAKAKEILAGLDIDDTLIASLVTDDENVTVTNASLLRDKLNSVRDTAINNTKEQLANIDVKPTPSNVTQGVMTWESYTQLSDEEQLKFAEEHPDEFKNL